MSRGLYTNLNEIPIPEWAKVNKANNTVYVILNTRNKRGDFNRRIIGKRANVHTMYVNDNFRTYYPEEWNKYYEDKMTPKSDFLHIGLYAAVLGILNKTGLYGVMLDSFGPCTTNAFIDFAMYSILYRSDAALSLQTVMSDEVLFSSRTFSDSWYSSLFHDITGDQRRKFQNGWLQKCKEDGLEEVWLCIDGSNNECSSSSSTLATPGHSKTKDSNDIVSYMYAVNGTTGIPVTYDVYYGSVVDKSAFISLATTLKANGIRIRGVILDRGFCTENVIRSVRELGCSYVIMAPSNTNAYITMMEKYSETIRWKVDHIVNEYGVFGIGDHVKLFSSSKEEGWAYLFFDGTNGSERSQRLIRNIYEAQREAKKSIANGKKISYLHGTKKYFIEKKDESGKVVDLDYNYKEWQADLDSKGYSVIISSDDLTPEKVDELYNMRDVSEKTYSMAKTQLGFSVTRVQGDSAILNKMALLFIATIIRREMINTAKKLSTPTNEIIAELDKINLLLVSGNEYAVRYKGSGKALSFLAEYDIDSLVLDAIVRDYNDRDRNLSLVRAFPSPIVKRGPGRPKKEKEPVQEHRKPGRPRGSKNKKTLLKEKKEWEKTHPPVKRKVGRPRKEGT